MTADDDAAATVDEQGRRVGLGVVLASAMGAGPLIIHVLAALAPAVTTEFGLSRTQFGFLATVTFAVTALLSVPAGAIVDRHEPRRMLGALFLSSIVALVWLGLSPGYTGIVLASAIAGLSLALGNPVTNRSVALLLPAGQRGLMMGVKQSGVQFLQALTGAVLPVLAVVIGWRAAVLTTPLLLVLGLGLGLVVMPRTLLGPDLRSSAGRDRGPVAPAVWWLGIYSVLMGSAMQAVNVYVPLYAFEALAFDAVRAGATTGVIGALGMLARIIWGRVAEHVATPQASLALLAFGGLSAVVLLHLAQTFSVLLWSGVVVHAVTVLAANVVTMMSVMRRVRLTELGRSSGVLSLGIFTGFSIGPVIFGLTVDRSGTYSAGWALLVVLYLCAIAITVAWARWERRTGAVHDVAA